MTLETSATPPLSALIAGLENLHAIRLLRDGQWQRTFGRIEGSANPAIVLVYEKPMERPLRIEISATEIPGGRRDGDDAWVSITTCSDDPALPTLHRALDVYRCGRIVRYRPGKRCTFEAIAGGRPAFTKVLADDRGAKIAADAVVLEHARASLDFEIADCLGWDRPLQALTHTAVAGLPVAPLLHTTAGKDLAGQLGDALASLPRSGILAGPVFGAREQMKRTAKYAGKFRKLTPALTHLVNTLLGALDQGHAAVADTQHRPIHGSPHPHQWLKNGARLALVDFDRLSRGPVEIDAATFVAELDFETGGMPDESAAFLATYSRRMKGLNVRLLAIYRAHKHFAKAFKVAQSIGPDRESRAELILRNTLRRLREELR